MRSIFRSGVVGAVICSAIVAAGACGGDDSNANAPSDAASDSTTDSPATGDASPTDAIADTSVNQPVHVLALGPSDQPLPGAVVVFYAPDGTPQSPLTTGADGTVNAIVAAGSSVTVLELDGSSALENDYDLTTILDVKPGDQLVVTAESREKKAADKPTIMTVSATASVAGATSYEWSDGCDLETAAFVGDQPLRVTSNCLDGGKLDVVGLANDITGLAIASTESAGITYVDGGSIVVPSWSSVAASTLPVTGSATGAPSTLDFDVAFFSNTTSFVNSSVTTPFGGGFVPPMIGKPTSAVLTDTLTTATVHYPGGATWSSIIEQTTQAHLASGFSLDFSSMPPPIHDPIVTADGAGNASFSFTADGALTNAKGMLSKLTFTVFGSDAGDAGAPNVVTWVILSPPTATLALPKLTSDLSPAFPSTVAFLSVSLLNGTTYPSYDDYRHAYPNIVVDELATAPYRMSASEITSN